MSKALARTMDTAGGGVITGTGVPTLGPPVAIGGVPVPLHVAVDGDPVGTHGSGDDTHSGATLIANPATKVTSGGKRVVLHGDLATCGHGVVASETKVTAG